MMNARRLVGMTMGARKRAARLNAEADYVNQGLSGLPPGWHRDSPYREYRRNLRIGERLRPCPWKHDERGCKGKGQEGSGPGDAYCEGSGVLPARVRSSHMPTKERSR